MDTICIICQRKFKNIGKGSKKRITCSISCRKIKASINLAKWRFENSHLVNLKLILRRKNDKEYANKVRQYEIKYDKKRNKTKWRKDYEKKRLKKALAKMTLNEYLSYREKQQKHRNNMLKKIQQNPELHEIYKKKQRISSQKYREKKRLNQLKELLNIKCGD